MPPELSVVTENSCYVHVVLYNNALFNLTSFKNIVFFLKCFFFTAIDFPTELMSVPPNAVHLFNFTL